MNRRNFLATAIVGGFMGIMGFYKSPEGQWRKKKTVEAILVEKPGWFGEYIIGVEMPKHPFSEYVYMKGMMGPFPKEKKYYSVNSETIGGAIQKVFQFEVEKKNPRFIWATSVGDEIKVTNHIINRDAKKPVQFLKEERKSEYDKEQTYRIAKIKII